MIRTITILKMINNIKGGDAETTTLENNNWFGTPI